MKNRHPIQYTIRNIPAEVDRRLRNSARHLHRSLNQALLDLLSRAAGVAAATAPYQDLDSFFGSWTADPQINKALSEQRTIDRKLWK